jgi:hypothetical protein
MAASRKDRDRFRRLYIKLTHYRTFKRDFSQEMGGLTSFR